MKLASKEENSFSISSFLWIQQERYSSEKARLQQGIIPNYKPASSHQTVLLTAFHNSKIQPWICPCRRLRLTPPPPSLHTQHYKFFSLPKCTTMFHECHSHPQTSPLSNICKSHWQVTNNSNGLRSKFHWIPEKISDKKVICAELSCQYSWDNFRLMHHLTSVLTKSHSNNHVPPPPLRFDWHYKDTKSHFCLQEDIIYLESACIYFAQMNHRYVFLCFYYFVIQFKCG